MIIQTTSKNIKDLIEIENGIQKLEQLIEEQRIEINCEDFLKRLIQIKLTRKIR